MRSNFLIEEKSDEIVIIRDVGPHNRFMSVTNDAEAVVESLIKKGELKTGQRLFYYDTENRLDELLVKGGKFAGFAPGPAVQS